jgi:hypothetical protein
MEQFGFYRVGDKKFFSKLEAAHEHERASLPLKWDFNDAVFSTLDWTVEPPESLEELYRQRAQQIRDKYDYLVLWFSGGADSSNILNTFINNDIKLDEVASQVNYEATHDTTNFLNGEIYHVAKPKVETARLKQPWLKHTIIDLAKQTVDHFTNKETKFDWIYHMNGYLNPNNASKQDIKLREAHWREMINVGKRVCFIHGIDKPRVQEVKGRYYFTFVDMVDTAVSGNTQMLNRPWEFDEMFYWSPDAPLIPVKQSHIIKRYMALATPTSPYITTDSKNVVARKIGNTNYYLTVDGISHLIYPGWYPVPFQAKAPSLFFTPRDEWFFKLPDSDPAKYAWRTGLEHIWRITPDKWKVNPADIYSGFKKFYSKPYDLGRG